MGKQFIDITPTWEALMPAMIAVLQNPKASVESHEGVTEELLRLARIVDRQIAKQKEAKENFVVVELDI